MRIRERLRVALYTYATQPRGGVVHAVALAEALHDLGHAVVLHALDDRGAGFAREPRCPYVIVRFAASRHDTPAYVRAGIAAHVAAAERGAGNFDIHHAQDGISGNALATLVERGRIPHFVRTVHHLDDFGTSELAALQDRSVDRARACFVVSRLWRDRVARDYGRQATVVPNGVDRTRFTPADFAERARLRTALGFGDTSLFVTIGGIEARKNTLALLDAFAAVRRTVPAARLVIAGGASIFGHGAYRRSFDVRAAELGLSIGTMDRARDVSIAGVLRDEEIVTLLRAADAFVFPSLVEGFGLVVLEALACATPAIVSAIPPFTEFLAPADALFVDPRDRAAIARAMLAALDPARRAALCARGPAVARRWSWRDSALAHLREYTAFLAAYATEAAAASRGVAHA